MSENTHGWKTLEMVQAILYSVGVPSDVMQTVETVRRPDYCPCTHCEGHDSIQPIRELIFHASDGRIMAVRECVEHICCDHYGDELDAVYGGILFEEVVIHSPS